MYVVTGQGPALSIMIQDTSNTSRCYAKCLDQNNVDFFMLK